MDFTRLSQGSWPPCLFNLPQWRCSNFHHDPTVAGPWHSCVGCQINWTERALCSLPFQCTLTSRLSPFKAQRPCQIFWRPGRLVYLGRNAIQSDGWQHNLTKWMWLQVPSGILVPNCRLLRSSGLHSIGFSPGGCLNNGTAGGPGATGTAEATTSCRIRMPWKPQSLQPCWCSLPRHQQLQLQAQTFPGVISFFWLAPRSCVARFNSTAELQDLAAPSHHSARYPTRAMNHVKPLWIMAVAFSRHPMVVIIHLWVKGLGSFLAFFTPEHHLLGQGSGRAAQWSSSCRRAQKWGRHWAMNKGGWHTNWSWYYEFGILYSRKLIFFTKGKNSMVIITPNLLRNQKWQYHWHIDSGWCYMSGILLRWWVNSTDGHPLVVVHSNGKRALPKPASC